jgi:hypothetical protein
MARDTGLIAAATLALAAPAASTGTAADAQAPRRAVEVRTYNLKPGARAEFHRLASEVAVPMLRRWNVDVVAHGPSPHDETSYYLIRQYADLAERQRSQDAFYGSDEWRQGPRDAILALIESYTTIVLELEAAAVDGLRRP